MKFLRRFQILILISVICIVSGELEVQDKCGIVGAYSLNKSKNVSRDIYYGLYALQHRGQESAGISSHNGRQMCTYRGMGLVCDVFNNGNVEELKGHVGIGHVRYSTTGKSLLENPPAVCLLVKVRITQIDAETGWKYSDLYKS